MRHNKASHGLYDVLGFYMNGIPAIFLGADIVLGADPALREYRAFSSAALPFPSGAAGTRLLNGFETGATLIHELRHFHDALLSRSLFMSFILRTSMNWTTLQLVGRWRHEMPGRLPVPLKTAAKRATGEMTGLFHELLKAAARYSDLERHFHSPTILQDGTRLTARDLLETNAVLAELFTLLVDHGMYVAERYYREVVRRLRPEYWRLMESAIKRCGGFQRALFGLHFAVSVSLWMGGRPLQTFAELFNGLSPVAADKLSNSDSWPIENIFQDEDEIRRSIDEAPIVAPSGSNFDITQLPEKARRLIELFKSIYQARANLVKEYVRGARANPLKYAQGIPGLPFPAVFFLPSERSKERGYLDGLAVEDINKPDHDLYVIRAHPDGSGRFVATAGIVDFPGGERSCVDFDLVDQSATLRYFYQRLFEERQDIFGREVDEMYEQVFSRVILGESDHASS